MKQYRAKFTNRNITLTVMARNKADATKAAQVALRNLLDNPSLSDLPVLTELRNPIGMRFIPSFAKA
jgi:hypothetical protein